MIAWQIASRWRQGSQDRSVSFVAKASSIGIVIGVMVLITALSVMNGFSRELAQRFLNFIPHIEFTAVEGPLDNWPTLVAKLQSQPDVKAAAPFIKVHGLAQKGQKLKAIELRGIELDREQAVSGFRQYFSNQLTELTDNQLIIGSEVLQYLGLAVGDDVEVLLANNEQQGSFQSPTRIKLTIVASFTMSGQPDQFLGYVPLAFTQKLLHYRNDQTQSLRVSLYDVYQSTTLARPLGQSLNEYVYLSDWQRTQGHLYQDIQLVRFVVYLVVALIIAVAGFNIISSLIMEVKGRLSDIAILKTMGATDKMILQLFMLKGMSQVIIATVIGVIAGVTLSLLLPEFFTVYEQLTGRKILDTVYFIDFIPSELALIDILVSVALTLAISLVAIIIPAWRAAKLQPTSVLGH